jgi:two-component system KDP operon response regulator KdpE
MTDRDGSTHEVLIIEDDAEIRRFLRTALAAEQYRLREATTAAEGLHQATLPPDVIVLDLGLPDRDGIEVIRKVREKNSRTPIIVLSVRGGEQDKIAALDAGADDFVTKPFAVGELYARLRVVLRRGLTAKTDSAVFRTGEIEVDPARHRVTVGGKEVRLTRTEYKLLTVMVRHADRVVTHSQLLKEVWGLTEEDQTHYVRVYMAQLRRKLEADPTRPRYLRTETGVGYRLTTE